DQTIAPSPLPPVSRGNVVRCVGSRRALAPGPSSTTTPHPQGVPARLHVPRRQGAPTRLRRVHHVASAKTLVPSLSRRPAAEAPCEAVQLQLATGRGRTHRR